MAKKVAEPIAEPVAEVAEEALPVAEAPAIPEWVKNPPEDQVVAAQVPVCDEDGSVIKMNFFNAAGQQVR